MQVLGRQGPVFVPMPPRGTCRPLDPTTKSGPDLPPTYWKVELTLAPTGNRRRIVQSRTTAEEMR